MGGGSGEGSERWGVGVVRGVRGGGGSGEGGEGGWEW